MTYGTRGTVADITINRQFFPLTASELGYDVSVDRVLQFGLAPQIHTEIDHAVDVPDAYVANYVREEIQQEAVGRNLASFARFLAAALVNAEVVNVAGIARDAAVARPTTS
jgi:hypothetical protein